MADDEFESTEATIESNGKKKLTYIIFSGLLVLVIVVGVVIAVLFFTVLNKKEIPGAGEIIGEKYSESKDTAKGRNDTEEKKTKLDLKMDRLRIMSGQQVPLTESSNYCKSKGMKLLVTTSQKEEHELVGYLRAHHNEYEECRKYFIGFHSVREKKFMSTNGNTFYPSLDTSYDAIKPNPSKMCAEVSLNANLAVREIPCSEVESLCFVCEYKEEETKCPQDNYLTSCYQDLILQTPKGAWVGYEFCELLHKPIWGLMPIDRKIPEKRKDYFRHIDNPKCKDVVYGVAVRFTHRYQTMSRKPMQYNSSRFVVTEPLYDCLAIDSTREFSLVTESCLAPNCALCGPNG